MEEENFEVIFHNYERMIKNMIRTLNIYKDTDEFYQIGAIALWEAWQKFDKTKGKFSAFAFLTVRGRMLEQLRKAKQYDERNAFVFDTIQGQHDVPHYDSMLERELIETYVTSLSDKQRTWVIEAIVNQKTPSEIAKQYNTSSEAVKSWRKEALKKLRARKQAFIQ